MILQALIQDSVKEKQSENAVKAYSVNWGAEIYPATVSTSTWSSEDNITIASQANTTTEASCTLTGNPGTYRIVNKITTSAGETDERIFIIYVTDNSGDLYSGCGRDYL